MYRRCIKKIHEENTKYLQVQEAFRNNEIARVISLKEMMPKIKEDPEAPTNILDILKTIDSINEVTTFHGKLGIQLQSKLKIFKEMEDRGMPQILNLKGELHPFDTWKEDLGGLLEAAMMHFSITHYLLLNSDIDMMMGLNKKWIYLLRKPRF